MAAEVVLGIADEKEKVISFMKTITVNGNQVEWEEGMTVSSLLNKMNYTFKMLVVKLNGVLVKKEQYDTTLVPEGAEVSIIHLISGG